MVCGTCAASTTAHARRHLHNSMRHQSSQLGTRRFLFPADSSRRVVLLAEVESNSFTSALRGRVEEASWSGPYSSSFDRSCRQRYLFYFGERKNKEIPHPFARQGGAKKIGSKPVTWSNQISRHQFVKSEVVTGTQKATRRFQDSFASRTQQYTKLRLRLGVRRFQLASTLSQLWPVFYPSDCSNAGSFRH